MNCIILTYLNIPTFVRDNSDRILVLNTSVSAASAVVFAVIKRILIDCRSFESLESTGVDLSKILGRQTKILGRQKVVKSDKYMGVSQLLGARARAAPPNVLA